MFLPCARPSQLAASCDVERTRALSHDLLSVPVATGHRTPNSEAYRFHLINITPNGREDVVLRADLVVQQWHAFVRGAWVRRRLRHPSFLSGSGLIPLRPPRSRISSLLPTLRQVSPMDRLFASKEEMLAYFDQGAGDMARLMQRVDLRGLTRPPRDPVEREFFDRLGIAPLFEETLEPPPKPEK
mgnify:CR=1 FL=1